MDVGGVESRYAVKRACQMDVAAIVRCRDLLQQFNGKLLDFEFRNGNLRSVGPCRVSS